MLLYIVHTEALPPTSRIVWKDWRYWSHVSCSLAPQNSQYKG